MRSRWMLMGLAVSIGALVASGAEAAEPADPPAAEAAPAEADPTREAQPFAGIELTADQERRVKEFTDARARWLAEHEDELTALREQSVAARKSGDYAAFVAARDRMLELRKSAPSPREIMNELSPEQRAKLGQTRGRREAQREQGDESDAERELRIERQKARLAERRQQRFAGVGLSEDQERRIGELSAARRAWHEQNQEQLQALRKQQRAARVAGDDEAEERATVKLAELRATAPEIDDILSELTDEQREQFKRNRPDRRKAPTPVRAGAETAPLDAAAAPPAQDTP